MIRPSGGSNSQEGLVASRVAWVCCLRLQEWMADGGWFMVVDAGGEFDAWQFVYNPWQLSYRGGYTEETNSHDNYVNILCKFHRHGN